MRLHSVLFLPKEEVLLCLIQKWHTLVILGHTVFILSLLGELVSKLIDIEIAECRIYYAHWSMVNLLLDRLGSF